MANLYAARILAEIHLLVGHFGPVCIDEVNLSEVLIEQFDLPRGFNRPYTQLLIVLGTLYPEAPPADFYLSRGLRKHGDEPAHYFPNGMGEVKYRLRGFAWYCLHLKRWHPARHIAEGHNLLTAVEAVYRALDSD